MKTKDFNRFQGCLFGGACGDALGYTVEFMNIEQIREMYGPAGLTTIQLTNGKAIVSDDTQLTLFTANGLLSASANERFKHSHRPIRHYLHDAYLDWHATQRHAAGSYNHVHSWLYNAPAMHSVRAPGGTCLRALSSGIIGTPETPINSSKGCGGVMRVSPIALYFDPARMPLDQIDRIGAECAAITHGHPLGYITAAALTHIINQAVYGAFSGDDALYDIVEDCVKAISLRYAAYPKISRLTELINEAVRLSKTNADDVVSIASIGEGWVAEEALAIAVYCALKYRGDFKGALIAAVNHSGDSDSTGSITGNILGAYLGYDAIPPSFLDHLELEDILREITKDLFADSANDDASLYESDDWQKKYIRCDYRM